MGIEEQRQRRSQGQRRISAIGARRIAHGRRQQKLRFRHRRKDICEAAKLNGNDDDNRERRHVDQRILDDGDRRRRPQSARIGEGGENDERDQQRQVAGIALARHAHPADHHLQADELERERRVILHEIADDEDDPQYERSAEALAILEAETDAQGRPLRVVKLLQPGPLRMTAEEADGVDAVPGSQPRTAGERLAGSYVNSYIGNGIVVLPLFDDPNDAVAVAAYEELFPGRRVLTVPGREILLGGGNVHCITQQLPSGR